MIFNRKRWHDIDWCDRCIVAKSLSDDELIVAASKVHPYSTALIELLEEGARRRLAAILPIARNHLTNSDPWIATPAASIVGEMGGPYDAPVLYSLIESAVDQYHLAAILEAILTIDPTQPEPILDIARKCEKSDNFDPDYVVAAVIACLARVLPDDSPNLEDRLLAWTTDVRLSPTQREIVFQRLAAIPRTERIEDFFIAFYINDDFDNPNLTRIVNQALIFRRGVR